MYYLFVGSKWRSKHATSTNGSPMECIFEQRELIFPILTPMDYISCGGMAWAVDPWYQDRHQRVETWAGGATLIKKLHCSMTHCEAIPLPWTWTGPIVCYLFPISLTIISKPHRQFTNFSLISRPSVWTVNRRHESSFVYWSGNLHSTMLQHHTVSLSKFHTINPGGVSKFFNGDFRKYHLNMPPAP